MRIFLGYGIKKTSLDKASFSLFFTDKNPNLFSFRQASKIGLLS